MPHPHRLLRAPKGGVLVFNTDAVIRGVDKSVARVFGQAILNNMSRTPFYELPSLKGDFDSLYVVVVQRGADVTPLENKVEALIN